MSQAPASLVWLAGGSTELPDPPAQALFLCTFKLGTDNSFLQGTCGCSATLPAFSIPSTALEMVHSLSHLQSYPWSWCLLYTQRRKLLTASWRSLSYPRSGLSLHVFPVLLTLLWDPKACLEDSDRQSYFQVSVLFSPVTQQALACFGICYLGSNTHTLKDGCER